jgi:hypothetical protein
MATAVEEDKVSVEKLYPSLLDSCGRGDVITTQFLLNQGLNVDYIDEKGNFPLLMASWFGRLELIKFLLDEGGASIDLVNPRGESALSKATEEGQTEIASLLQQYGANSEQISTPKQSSGHSVKEELGDDKATTAISHRVGPEVLGPALSLLFPVASHWQNIGVLLDISPYALRFIRYDNPNSATGCLREVLIKWVKRVDPPPTWEELMEAIELINPYLAYKGRTYMYFNT